MESPGGSRVPANRLALTALTMALIALGSGARAGSEVSQHQVLHQFHPNAVRPSGLIRASDGNFYGTTSQAGESGAGTVFRMTPSGEMTTLHSFTGGDGSRAQSALIEGTDGSLYGATNLGGAHNLGTVFKITPSGAFVSLHSFSRSDGANPQFGRWIQASDGALYGTTMQGGAKNLGTVFKLDPSGDPDDAPLVTTLHSFGGGDGSFPSAGLIEASDGKLYGTTAAGGTSGVGTVFVLDPSGSVTILHSFSRGDGMYPQAELLEGSDGSLYGTTPSGGLLNTVLNRGTVFKITKAGVFTSLHSFLHVDGTFPAAGLVQAADGNFYGTTNQGGTGSTGTIFRMDPSGKVTALHSFQGTDGANPEAGLIQTSDGSFYGTTNAGGPGGDGTIFNMDPAGSLTTVHAFADDDGFIPRGGLTQASDGNFYGTTNVGGRSTSGGTVFRMDPSGTLTTLHAFSGNDGQFPNNCRLVEGSDGSLYGTTSYGGGPSGSGYGAVFKITKSGSFTSLHSFALVNGASPSGGLTLGNDGNLYGLTWDGGLRSGGTAYKITPSGTFASLHSFDGTDGRFPFGTLIQGSDGNLYGTTNAGGANGAGTVFKMDTSGAVTTLHSFAGTDGSQPYGGLTQGSDGALYGTTTIGGEGHSVYSGHGTVFKITPSGTFTSLHSFDRSDGALPHGELTLGTDGNLYGTTSQGGAGQAPSSGFGTVFRITPGGTLTTLHRFSGIDGTGPYGGPTQAHDGSFYGTTEGGGLSYVGVAYRLEGPPDPN